MQGKFTSRAESDCAEFAFRFHAIESMALGLLLACSISLKDHTLFRYVNIAEVEVGGGGFMQGEVTNGALESH